MGKQSKNKLSWRYFFVVIIIIFLFFAAIFVFDNETEANTQVATGYISDLVYGSDHQKSWALFVLDGNKYYYQFYSKPQAKEDFNILEQIQQNNIPISIRYTEERDILRMFIDFDGAYHVVSIFDSNHTYFDISLHNREQTINRVLCYIFGSVLAAVTFFFWWLLEVYLTPRKRKKKHP